MTVLCRQTLNPQGSGNSRHNNPIQEFVFFSFFFQLQLLCSQNQFFTLRYSYVALIHSTWHIAYELIFNTLKMKDKLIKSH